MSLILAGIVGLFIGHGLYNIGEGLKAIAGAIDRR